MADDTAAEADEGDEAEARPAPTGLTRDQYHDRERAAFLAELGAGEGDGEAAKPAKAKPAPVESSDDDDDDDDDAEPDEDEDDDAETVASDDDEDEEGGAEDVEPDDEDDLADKAKADPELAKRLAAVRRTDQRQRERFAQERSAFDRERSEWQAQRQQLVDAKDRFDKLAARVRYNPTAVLRELGLTDDDFEGAAQHIASHSKAAGVTPAHRAAAERAMRDREAADEAKALRAEVKELKDGLTANQREAAEQREAEVYVGRVLKRATDETPLTQQLIAKNPTKARADLTITAFKLAQKLGQLPKTRAVIAAHEKKLARELRDLGIEPPAKGAKPAVAAKPAPAKPGAKPAPAAAAATETNGRVKFPTRDEMIREMTELDKQATSDN